MGKFKPFLGCSLEIKEERKKRRETHFQNDKNGIESYFSEAQIKLNLSIHDFVPSFTQTIFIICIKSGTNYFIIKKKILHPPGQ